MMRYTFFDIESANCFNHVGKICSIGYIITDENFNVLEKQTDLLVNPETQFDWYVLKNILAYQKSEFLKANAFPSLYDDVKCLVEGDDIICIGFDVKTDVDFLLDACYRYNLSPYKIKFFDVRKLSDTLIPECGALEKAYAKWCDDVAEGLHRSDVDAYYTMRVLKAICEREKTNITECINKYLDFVGTTENYLVSFMTDVPQDYREKYNKEKKKKQKKQPKQNKTDNNQ